MIIQSLIKRQQGSEVLLGTTNYKFLPNAAGDHVAEVSVKAHVDTLLAIEHGFKEYKAAGNSSAAKEAAAKAAALEYEAAAAAEAEVVKAEAAKAAALAEAAAAAEAAAKAEAEEAQAVEQAVAAPVAEPVAAPVVNEKEALLAEAKALGLKVNSTWGVGGLKKAIAKAKGN